MGVVRVKRLLIGIGIVASMGMGPASAGNVCINNDCNNVPGVYGNLSYSQTGLVKASGGVTGGPGVAETGVTLISFKADYIAADIMLDGESQGRWFWYADYGDERYAVNMGKYGCRQIGDGYVLGPCINDPNG